MWGASWRKAIVPSVPWISFTGSAAPVLQPVSIAENRPFAWVSDINTVSSTSMSCTNVPIFVNTLAIGDPIKAAAVYR